MFFCCKFPAVHHLPKITKISRLRNSVNWTCTSIDMMADVHQCNLCVLQTTVNGNSSGMKMSWRQRLQGRPCRSRGGLETSWKTSMRLAILTWIVGSHTCVITNGACNFHPRVASPITLVFSPLTSPRNSKGNIGSGGAEWERGRKNAQFLANKSP